MSAFRANLPPPTVELEFAAHKLECALSGGALSNARHTILVVDDDPSFRDLYTTALRLAGFDVVTSSDGLTALQHIEQDPPSLIILDLNMPCVDGWSVLQELGAHESTRAIPVIVVTGADVNKATLQAQAIVRKPATPDQVLPLIDRVLPVV